MVCQAYAIPALLASLPVAAVTTDCMVGGEAGPRGRVSTNFGPEVWPSTSYQVCEHAPQVFFKSRAPKRREGSAGSFPVGSDPTGLLRL